MANASHISATPRPTSTTIKLAVGQFVFVGFADACHKSVKRYVRVDDADIEIESLRGQKRGLGFLLRIPVADLQQIGRVRMA